MQHTLGRAVDYCLLKIVFIAAIGSSTTVEVFCWASWFAAVGFVKLFSGLARDRFDSLLSTPVATAVDYARSVSLPASQPQSPSLPRLCKRNGKHREKRGQLLGH